MMFLYTSKRIKKNKTISELSIRTTIFKLRHFSLYIYKCLLYNKTKYSENLKGEGVNG